MFWLLLIFIVIFQIVQKKNDIFYLKIALYFFLTGSILCLITLIDFSEFFMRVSFIFFLVGLILSLFRKEK